VQRHLPIVGGTAATTVFLTGAPGGGAVPQIVLPDQLKKATDRLVTGDVLMTSSRTRKIMQTDSEKAGGKGNQSGGLDPQKEAAYWREQHPKQPYAKDYSYEQFEHAYRTGYDSFLKYPGQTFDEVEESVANEYEQAKPDSALPWDTVRPAVSSVWDRLGGVISPRDPDRGIRGAI
jgi:hypothetical protein